MTGFDEASVRGRFGSVRFSVRCVDPVARAAVLDLGLSDPGSVDATAASASDDAQVAMWLDRAAGSWRLTVADGSAGSGGVGPLAAGVTRFGAPVPAGGEFGSLGAAVHALLTVLTERAVRSETAWTHVHAGAVAVGDVGVVIPAVSGTGKTTLTSELGRCGAVLTDELVAIDRPGGVLRAPHRPLSVKASGFARFAARHPEVGDPPAHDEGFWHVPLGTVGLAHRPAAAAGVVLVPDRRSGTVEIEPVDPGEALLILIENSFDLDVDPIRAFGDLAWLVEACHTIRVGYGDAADVGSALRDWLADAAPPSSPADEPERLDDESSDVLAARVGTGAVLWQPRSRAVAWVDAAGAAAWQARSAEGADFVAGLFDVAGFSGTAEPHPG